MKLIMKSGLIAVAIVAALAFLSQGANAQFRPCVWPNTCVN